MPTAQSQRTLGLLTFVLVSFAVCISFGCQHIGAAAGTFVFYATVLAGLAAYDLATRNPVPRLRTFGAVISLAGVGVLTAPVAGDGPGMRASGGCRPPRPARSSW